MKQGVEMLAERLRAAVTYQYMPMAVRMLLSEAAEALNTHPAATGSVREAETATFVAAASEVDDPDHQYAVVSSNYSRPFLVGAYPTLDAALLAQDGEPDRWHIYRRLPAAPDAAASEAGEGWQPIETAVLWEVYVVTDGENVAKAQLAESDYGDQYWSVDPEDCLEWEPTHCIAALTTQGGAEG